MTVIYGLEIVWGAVIIALSKPKLLKKILALRAINMLQNVAL